MCVADIRVFPGLGNKTCEYSGTKRLQVYRNERLQRGDHVCHWCRHFVRPVRRPGRIFHHHLHLHLVLHYWYIVSGLRTKGELVAAGTTKPSLRTSLPYGIYNGRAVDFCQ